MSDSKKATYSFHEPPFVNPKIVNEFVPWVSDTGDQIVAVNVTDSQGANRYFSKIEINREAGKSPWVSYSENGETFSYRHIGRTNTEVHVLVTRTSGGGSGVWMRILFLEFQSDTALRYSSESSQFSGRNQPRFLLKKLGDVALGDRWNGEFALNELVLVIGKDTGMFRHNSNEIEIDLSNF